MWKSGVLVFCFACSSPTEFPVEDFGPTLNGFPSRFVATGLPPSQSGTLSAVTTIDTTSMRLKQVGTAFHEDPSFQLVGEVAVLSLEAWTISEAVVVQGIRPLLVVARGAVVIAASGSLDASAFGDTTAPGGYPSAEGPGAGGSLTDKIGSDAGGGGASYGKPGGAAGGSVGSWMGGAAGASYGGWAMFVGGSGGGNGAPPTADADCIQGAGGAGGGAIQISSTVNVQVEGSINVGGGGGLGGCVQGTTAAGGGGGGAGGQIFLEAPELVIGATAKLSALGGGGGSGALGADEGEDGSDGQLLMAAMGGESVGAGSQIGGTGATAQTAAGLGGGGTGKAGGGGGGAGRIYLRSKGSMRVAGQIAPSPESDLSL